MGETSVTKIPVNGMNLAIPQEMVERWHQDLRTIIKLHEDNGRLQLLLYETQDKLREAQNTRGMSARERGLASQLELAEEHNRELVQSLREMAEKVSTRQSSAPQQEGESKRNRELTETVAALRESLEKLRKENERLSDEVTRLKEGQFTEEEFQALCHRFQKEDCQRFCKGCLNYWVNLFGKDKLTPVLIDAARDVIAKAQLRWTHRDHHHLVTQSQHEVETAFAEDVVASLFELYCYNSKPCDSKPCDSKPKLDASNIPLPIIHSDFEFSLKKIRDDKTPDLLF